MTAPDREIFCFPSTAKQIGSVKRPFRWFKNPLVVQAKKDLPTFEITEPTMRSSVSFAAAKVLAGSLPSLDHIQQVLHCRPLALLVAPACCGSHVAQTASIVEPWCGVAPLLQQRPTECLQLTSAVHWETHRPECGVPYLSTSVLQIGGVYCHVSLPSWPGGAVFRMLSPWGLQELGRRTPCMFLGCSCFWCFCHFVGSLLWSGCSRHHLPSALKFCARISAT